MYEEFVLPITQEIAAWATRQGVRDLPLVIGGNTTPIAELLARAGCNDLLCDFTGDFDEWSAVARGANKALRRNLSPRLIEKGTPRKSTRRPAPTWRGAGACPVSSWAPPSFPSAPPRATSSPSSRPASTRRRDEEV
jgi:hypothetical protein